MFSASFLRSCQPLTITTHGGKIIARAGCASCGENYKIESQERLSPEAIKKRFNRIGWALGRKAKCPTCKSREAVMTLAKVHRMLEPECKKTSAAVDTREQRRLAHMLLESEFHIATGAFTNGYSDERIAKETDLSVDWVKKRREDEFGPLKTPDEITALKTEIKAVQAQVSSLQERLANLCIKQGWAA